MKKLAFALTALAALSLLAPTTGSAQQEYGATLGLYLDTEATLWEVESVTPGVVPVYLCMVEHDVPALYGYEFGFTVEGPALISQVLLQGTGPIDVGGGIGNHIVGLASPMTTTPVTLIAQINAFVTDGSVSTFTVHGGTPNSVPGSTTPALLLANDLIIRAGTSGWDGSAPAPCLTLNTTGVVVSTDEVTLDGIKSLYR